MCSLKVHDCNIIVYCYMAQMFTTEQMKRVVDSIGPLHTVSKLIQQRTPFLTSSGFSLYCLTNRRSPCVKCYKCNSQKCLNSPRCVPAQKYGLWTVRLTPIYMGNC